jgi:PAS domain S-box-containing protein
MNGSDKPLGGEKKQGNQDGAEEGIITVDADRRVVIINAVARDMLGVAESSVIGREVSDMMPADPPSQSHINTALLQVLSSRSSADTIEHVRLIPQSGTESPWALTLTPIIGDTGDVVGAVLTIRRDKPEKDRSADMPGREGPVALNTLVGKIAHDVNNSLSSVLANIQLARFAADEKSDVYRRLNSAETSVLQARDLTGQLLALSAGSVGKFSVSGSAAQKKRPATRPQKEKPPAKVTAVKKKAAPGKILLMDDNEAILSATSEMLKFIGYEIVVAENGDAAVEMYGKAQDTGLLFDAVVLDVTVPGGMGALETLPKLRKIDPNVRAIVSSGYSTNPIIVDFASYGFTAAIIKPYGFKELGEALEAAFRS